MKKSVLATVMTGLCALPAAPALSEINALQLVRTMGGQIGDIVVSAPYAYIATGRVVVTWDYSDPNAPTQVGAVDKPAQGRLTGLVRHGNYLYASWRTGYGACGVAVYALTDPAQPKLVNEVEIRANLSDVNAIAASNGHLFLFDMESGVIVASLADPQRPLLRSTGLGASVAYEDAFTDGNWVHAFGKNLMGNAVLTSFDVSSPRAPQEAPSFYADGVEFFSMRYQSPLAVAFGMKLSILDLTDPREVKPRGSAYGPLAMTGIVNGNHAYGLGFDGLDVWDISDLDNPLPGAHLDIDTLGTDATASMKGGALIVTRTDRLVHLDTSDPAAPKEQGSALMRGSIDAYDAAAVGDTVLFAQQNYGLAIADGRTLEVIGRHEFDLPPMLQARVFNDMHLDGNLAYLAGWGYGLFIADISNPRAPVELARQEYAFAHTVSVERGRAYVGRNTEDPAFGIVDVSNPAQPSLLGSYSVGYSPAQVEARDGYLYIAGYANASGVLSVGLRVLDVSDPFGPLEVAYYDDNCPSAFSIAFAKDTPLAYLACSNGLHILDVSSPKMPTRVAYVPVAETAHPYASVAVRGNRAWYGSTAGVYEVDVTDPKAPRQVGFADLAGYGVVNVRAIDENRLLALTGVAGIHVLNTGVTALVNRKAVSGISGAAGAQLLYALEVPTGAGEVRFQTHGGTGDITLYVKHGAPPTATDYDAVSMQPGTSEVAAISQPQAGIWYVRIVGETAFQGVTLSGAYR